MGQAVGIDFGTSSCGVAAVQAGRPVIIPNAEGEHTTPCVVHVTSDGARLAGTPAQPWAVRAPRATLSRVKSLLGKRYTELRDEERQQFPELECGPNDTVRVRLHEKLYPPEELAAVILGKLLEDASQFLHERISTAVISVPASFTHTQRRALWDAGRIAGIRDLQLINEPTAAALAYGFVQPQTETVLVFDLGSGTTDVSVFEIGSGICETRASVGAPALGGNDFDRSIVDHLADPFVTGQRREDSPLFHQLQAHLYATVEQAKCELSTALQTTLPLPPQLTQNILSRSPLLARTQVERCTEPLIARCLALVFRALAAARVTPHEIDTVMLVGGATRMPVVHSALANVFGPRVRFFPGPPDSAVATGAALQAGLLTGAVMGRPVFETTPLRLSAQSAEGRRTRLIEANTPLPCRTEALFFTLNDQQSSIEIDLWQGAEATAEQYLGALRLDGLPLAPGGRPQLGVTLSLDTSGLLDCTAHDHDTGRPLPVTLQHTPNLSQTTVEELSASHTQARARAWQVRETARLQHEAALLIHRLDRLLQRRGPQVPVHDRLRTDQLLARLRNALSQGATPERLRRMYSDGQQLLYGLSARTAVPKR